MPRLLNSRKNSGFTLIELMVVISIIALLSALILAAVVNAQISGRDARRISDVEQIQNAVEEYYNDHGSYPLADKTDYNLCMNRTFGGSSWSSYLCAVESEVTVFSTGVTFSGTVENFGASSGMVYGSSECESTTIIPGDNYSVPNWSTCSNNNLASALSKYITLPIDPLNNTVSNDSGEGESFGGVGILSYADNGATPEYDYSYSVTGDGQHYEVFAQLEKGSTGDCGNNSTLYALQQGYLTASAATVSTYPTGQGFFDPTGQLLNSLGSIYDFCKNTPSPYANLENFADFDGGDTNYPYSPLIFGLANK